MQKERGKMAGAGSQCYEDVTAPESSATMPPATKYVHRHMVKRLKKKIGKSKDGQIARAPKYRSSWINRQ
jgi:hypothetical protein